MKYRFTAISARLCVWAGLLILALGLLYAVWFATFYPMDNEPPGIRQYRVPIAISIAVVWLVIGGSMVIGGQLLLVFLEQRRLLARQLAATRQIARQMESVLPQVAGPTFGERTGR